MGESQAADVCAEGLQVEHSAPRGNCHAQEAEATAHIAHVALDPLAATGQEEAAAYVQQQVEQQQTSQREPEAG